jgi:adenylate cyclase
VTGGQVKRRLAAILAADVAGYTKHMAADEAATVAALDAARLVFREHIESQGGRVVDMAGDSVLAVFETATGATEAALAVQKALTGRDMQFRIGIHLGEVIEKPDGTVYGDGVDLAARLEGLAAPGGVCISAAVSYQVTGKIDDAFENIGEHVVKNVPTPVHAFAWGGVSMQARAAERRKPTVALGAFEAKGGDEAEMLAAGAREGIATSLANQTGWEMLSDTHGADFVVSATVQVAGSRYRAASRILDTKSGAHFAADRFDGDLDDPFIAQDDLTYRMYNAVRFGLHRREVEMAEQQPASSNSDEALILKASEFLFQPYIEKFLAARPLLDSVLARSPENYMALAMRASSHVGELFAGYRVISATDCEAALRNANEAVRLNGHSDFTQYTLGMTLLACRGDHKAAEAQVARSLELNPFYAFANQTLGVILITDGRVEEGIALCAKVAASDPRDRIASWATQFVALGHLVARRYGEAVEWAQRSDHRQPDVARTLLVLAAAAALNGDSETARQATERMLARYPDFRLADFGNLPFKDPEPAERLVEGLRLAGLPE